VPFLPWLDGSLVLYITLIWGMLAMGRLGGKSTDLELLGYSWGKATEYSADRAAISADLTVTWRALLVTRLSHALVPLEGRNRHLRPEPTSTGQHAVDNSKSCSALSRPSVVRPLSR
jgi:hypothetical protein